MRKKKGRKKRPPGEPVAVFRRKAPGWAKLLSTLSLIGFILTPYWLMMAIPAYAMVADVQPFGRVAVVGGILFMPVVALTTYLLLAITIRRRYGHCELFRGHAVFEVPLGKSVVVIRLIDVQEREPNEWGMVLRTGNRSRLRRLVFPLFVPAQGEKLHELVQTLDEIEARREGWDKPDEDPAPAEINKLS